jgi:beta-lactamase regulating signal transducer with metallopeptidase domain
MILSWMLYASAVALLLALAAWTLEGVVRQHGWPVRGVWIGALLGSLLIPVLTSTLPPERTSPVGTAAANPTAEHPRTPSVPAVWAEWAEPLTSAATAPARKPDLDSWILALWGIASTALALALALSYRALIRRRGEWVRREVDGRTVWVSRDTGPAVIGFLPGRVVMPEWLLGARATDRLIALAHEEEHVRARDPGLLLGTLLLCVALPWNLALWWIAQRLRRAVEIDCDLRVLARGVDPRAYSRLLVEVMERGAALRFGVAALSESPSFLERRIRIMLASRSRWWWSRASASLLLASGMVTAACQVDRPGRSPIPATGATYAVDEDGALSRQSDTVAVVAVDTAPKDVEISAGPEIVPPAAPASEALDPLQVAMRAAIAQFYPNLLTERIAGGRTNVYLLADDRGAMVKTAIDTEERSGSCGRILESGLGATVDRKATEAAGCMRLIAGRAGPSEIHIYWAALKARPGAEGAPPAGPYRFAAIARRDDLPDAVLQAAIERHHPDALREGLPLGEILWFIADRNHRVLHAGRGRVYGSSRTAELELEERFPGLDIGAILMSSRVRAATGDRIRLIWATLKEPGSAPDPGDGQAEAVGRP